MEKKINDKRKVIKPNKIKIIFVSILTVAVIIYGIYAIWQLASNPTDVFLVEQGSITQEERVEGYIIRKEEKVQGNNYKNGMVQIKAEGEKCAKDENIFRYYTKGEENLVAKIQELDEKIDEAQKNDTTSVFSSDIKLLDKEIELRLNELSKTNDIQKITEYKKEIENYIKKKTEIIGENSKSGSYLNKLIQQRKEYEKKLNSGSEYIKAPMSGVVSYKVDGLEDVLTPDDFSSYNRSFFESLNLKTGQAIATSTESGKVVNNYECYIATIIKKDKTHDIEKDDRLELRLSNGDEISARVYYIHEQTDDDVLVVFRITKDVEKLIDNRKISFDIIFWQYSGYKVPNTAIIKEDDLAYVIRNRAGYLSRVLVKVEKESDTYSIIDNYDSDELKEMGVSSSSLNASTKINLYDEIQAVADENVR